MKERKKENAWGLVWCWWVRMGDVGIKRGTWGFRVKGEWKISGKFFWVERRGAREGSRTEDKDFDGFSI